MDEVDSIGSARTDSGGGGGDSEVQRTMLELLNQLDGFEATNKIKVGVSSPHASIVRVLPASVRNMQSHTWQSRKPWLLETLDALGLASSQRSCTC